MKSDGLLLDWPWSKSARRKASLRLFSTPGPIFGPISFLQSECVQPGVALCLGWGYAFIRLNSRLRKSWKMRLWEMIPVFGGTGPDRETASARFAFRS